MNKKLSALSKPVTVDPVTVETVRERLSFLDDLNARGVGTAVRSQQFEIACLRELLAAEQHAAALLADDERLASDLVARNGEIEGLRERAAELEAKLATPVRLPNKNDDEFWFGSTFQVAKFDRAVERAISSAGFKFAGD
ncbi:hypothetical protein [Serratia marcescens]|uniref:Ead/Ea22-like family protein n=1 Tax=Serratia marcescens TaxID=615 RepID=A0ABD5IMA9_SERMA|nr:hypothetical protein [Serratia marcescens]MDX7085237.1 hypothetical protein [Serratia marcescens]